MVQLECENSSERETTEEFHDDHFVKDRRPFLSNSESVFHKLFGLDVEF